MSVRPFIPFLIHIYFRRNYAIDYYLFTPVTSRVKGYTRIEVFPTIKSIYVYS